jgi:hypothetical protein
VSLRRAVIEFARKAGFTVAEIKLLFHGFRKNASFGTMGTASAKEIPRDGYPDRLPERYAETLEEKHELPLR